MKVNKIIPNLWRVLFILIFVLSFGQTNPVYAAFNVDFAITVSHTDPFVQADQNKTYTINIQNLGDNSSTGQTITVSVSPLPTGLTATALNGTGWSCTLGSLTCTTNAVIPSGGYTNPITLTVNVAVNAPTPRSVTATVASAEDEDNTNDSYTDVTNITQKPDLIITGYELRNAANTETITTVAANEAFYIRFYIQNQGGADTGLFYPGVFLDDKPNYGIDHEVFGEVTSFQDYRIAPQGSLGFPQGGCLYYDPAGDGLIDPLTEEVQPERGNYTRIAYNPALPAGASTTVDVYIGYPESEYSDPNYNSIRTGLPAGSYNIYLYVDPNCSGGDRESNEENNSYGPISLSIGNGVVSGPADITVSINGDLKGTYSLDPNEHHMVKYSTAVGGPVVISNNNGVGIVASLLQLRRPGFSGGYTGIAQLMALPIEQLSDTFVFPRYHGNDLTKYNSIEFSNLDTISTDVTVTIGGTVMGTYTVAPNAAYSVRYTTVAGGPVVVQSNNGARIISQIYELKRSGTSGFYNGQSQMTGVPGGQISDTYILPWYNGTLNDLDATLIFGIP
jgi:hypothetical protein